MTIVKKRSLALLMVPTMSLVAACGDGGDSSLDSLPMLGTQVTVASTTPDGVIATTTTVAAVEQTYTIQQGDTLSYIAGQFGVTVEAIVTANGLANPDAIQAGQKLVIPAGGAPTSTSAAPATTTSTTVAAP
jgi:LysM repeat protein